MLQCCYIYCNAKVLLQYYLYDDKLKCLCGFPVNIQRYDIHWNTWRKCRESHFRSLTGNETRETITTNRKREKAYFASSEGASFCVLFFSSSVAGVTSFLGAGAIPFASWMIFPAVVSAFLTSFAWAKRVVIAIAAISSIDFFMVYPLGYDLVSDRYPNKRMIGQYHYLSITSAMLSGSLQRSFPLWHQVRFEWKSCPGG